MEIPCRSPLVKFLLLVVNHHIASQASHQFRVPGAGRCRHLSAEVFRELDRKRGNAANACGDEHLVAGLEVRTLLQALATPSARPSGWRLLARSPDSPV